MIDADPDADEPEDFDALSQRIHPAASRIELLAQQTPARYVAFDLLSVDDEVLLAEPFASGAAGSSGYPEASRWPRRGTAAEAEPWLRRAEGVVAKDVNAAYAPGKRTAMVKVKRARTIDAVITGYRPGKEAGTVGSLILGLYDDRTELRIVGHCSGIKPAEKRALCEHLAPTRPAPAAAATRAAGRTRRSSSGSNCDRSWSSRSASTSPVAGASVTAPSCCAGAMTSPLGTARSVRCRNERLRRRRPLGNAVAAHTLGLIERLVGSAQRCLCAEPAGDIACAQSPAQAVGEPDEQIIAGASGSPGRHVGMLGPRRLRQRSK